ncbi:MAG: molybdopterin biosynthesis protein [Lachnospiraceae bacterium]|nr:molybdopterin biosynthesis protein [Lachnospiraceae bacterium]
MAFEYLTNIPLEKARAEYIETLKNNGFSPKTETVAVHLSSGRITASPVYAAICAPHYPASAMDGITVKAASTFGASETTPIILGKDDFIVVDTGDPIPDSMDAVIMIEDVVWTDDKCAKIFAPASPWQHIRQIGEDICAGEMILASNMKITPSAVGAMLAGGVMEVEVIKKPIVGVIPTGDEIVPPTADPAPGDIIEFNSSIFSAMVKEWGAEAIAFPIVPDKFDKIKEAVENALDKCDIVILNAGSSAGREDFSTEVIRSVGNVLYHGIAIKPGKPAILGYKENKPILGVPGYPVSGIIVIEQFIKLILEEWYASSEKGYIYKKAILARTVVSGLKYEEFVRVRLGMVNGKLVASPLNRGSGVVSSFMKADGILEIPQGVEGYEAGEEVNIRLLRNENELSNTLVAIGSHDPLLDEIMDMLHSSDPTMFMSSTHTGSMGGIMAVKRGETHIAGTHLLDEADGSYNYSYIEKYFPNGGVYLVECVERTQGLMLKKGNPLNINTISDLKKDGVRYVNRQKGSGTRILTDYLCKKENIAFSDIYGYDREELTHTSVAAQIASDTADAGMGIYSAAKLYDLDFVPVCMEQYDLLIPESAWDTPMVKRLIEVLKSDEFRSRLDSLGGYKLTNPGEVRRHF